MFTEITVIRNMAFNSAISHRFFCHHLNYKLICLASEVFCLGISMFIRSLWRLFYIHFVTSLTKLLFLHLSVIKKIAQYIGEVLEDSKDKVQENLLANGGRCCECGFVFFGFFL